MTFWFQNDADFIRPLLGVLFAYAGVIVMTRIFGLRSFAKMSSFDFAATIATGSLISATALGTMPVASGLVAVAALFAGQAAMGFTRKSLSTARKTLDNMPILLMDGPDILHENLAKVAVTEADLFGKLREANVHDLGEVRAVVMETTGDISVLHSDDPARKLSGRLLDSVVR